MGRGQTRQSVRVGQVPLLYYRWGHGHRRIGAWEKAVERGSLHPEPSLKPGPGATPGAGSTCKSSSTECSKVIGKLERADWIFPRSPKKTMPEEREKEKERQGQRLPGSQSCLQCPVLPGAPRAGAVRGKCCPCPQVFPTLIFLWVSNPLGSQVVKAVVLELSGV